MKKLTQLEKFGLMAGAIVVMSFFYMNKMYDPQAKALEKTIKELNRVTEELQSLKPAESAARLKKKQAQKKKSLAAINMELEKLSLQSGTPEGLVKLEEKIYTAISESGLVISEVKPGEPVEELFTWHVYNIRLTGNHGNFITLIGKLKEFPDPVKIGKINFSREKTGRAVSVSFTLKI